MLLQFGLNMVVPIAMTTALGVWVDHRYETGFATILLFFAGAAAGAQNVYRMAKKIYGSGNTDQSGSKAKEGEAAIDRKTEG